MSGSRSLARAAPPRKRKIRHAFFLLFSQVASFFFSPFFLCSFLFLASDVVDLVPIWYVALYLAINLCKSSTRCNTSFSTPDLIWCRFSLLKLWRQFRPVVSLPPSINRLSSCLVMFSVMAWSLSNYLDCPIVAVIMGRLVLLSEKPFSTSGVVGRQIAKTIFKLFIFYS